MSFSVRSAEQLQEGCYVTVWKNTHGFKSTQNVRNGWQKWIFFSNAFTTAAKTGRLGRHPAKS
eukprot:6224233-Amphidinium_carterae.1